jgi:hypothetical protein
LRFDFSINPHKISLGPVIHTANHSQRFDWADNHAFLQAKPASMPSKTGLVNTLLCFFLLPPDFKAVRAYFLTSNDNGLSYGLSFRFLTFDF